MVHGGPFPATSDTRTTSVGTLAINRFLRPVAYQNLPQELLPVPLQDPNPRRLNCRIDGVVQAAEAEEAATEKAEVKRVSQQPTIAHVEAVPGSPGTTAC